MIVSNHTGRRKYIINPWINVSFLDKSQSRNDHSSESSSDLWLKYLQNKYGRNHIYTIEKSRLLKLR